MATRELPVTGIAFGANALHVTSDERAATLQRKSLSVSAAQKLDQCPASWVGQYTVPETVDPFAAKELGTAAHAALETFYTLPPAQRTRQRLTEIATLAADQYWETNSTLAIDTQQQQTWREQMNTLALGDFDIEDPTTVNVYRTELAVRGLTLPNGVPFTGFIDRVDYAPGHNSNNPRFEIVDYKTGAYRKHNPRFGRNQKHDQIRIYAAVTAAALDVPLPSRGRLLFTAHAVDDTVDTTSEAVQDSLDWFANQWQALSHYQQTRTYPYRPGPLCGWCPLANGCPVAKFKTDERELEHADNNTNTQRKRKSAQKARNHAEATFPTAQQLGIPAIDPEAQTTATPRIKETTGTIAETEHPAMSEQLATQPRPEGKTFDELVPFNGQMVLNLNSYAATRVFGLSSLAYAHVKTHAPHSDAATIQNFAHLIADIIMRAEAQLTGHGSWQSGANTRVTGLLRESLEQMPAPFGETRETWSAWHAQTIARILYFANLALELYERQSPDPTGYLDALAS